MSGHAQAYGGEAGGDHEGNGGEGSRPYVSRRKDQGQGTGPELLSQLGGSFRPSGDQGLRHFYRGYVDDERTGCGTPLYSIDAGHGFGVQRVGAQTIHGFGGESDQTSGAEEAGGVFDLGRTDEWERLGHRSF